MFVAAVIGIIAFALFGSWYLGRPSKSKQLPSKPATKQLDPYRVAGTVVAAGDEKSIVESKPSIDVIGYNRKVGSSGEQCLWCPKCLYGTSVKRDGKDTHPEYCTCNQYRAGHFHFICCGCKYTCIMKGAS